MYFFLKYRGNFLDVLHIICITALNFQKRPKNNINIIEISKAVNRIPFTRAARCPQPHILPLLGSYLVVVNPYSLRPM